MVRICVRCIVQNNCLCEIPPENAEIFDVVSEHTGTVILVQTVSTRGIINKPFIKTLEEHFKFAFTVLKYV